MHFDKVHVSNERILARGDTAISALDACLDVATVLAMAEAVGYCEGITRLTAEYDLQLFTRRARAFCSAYSDTEDQFERAAVALGL